MEQEVIKPSFLLGECNIDFLGRVDDPLYEYACLSLKNFNLNELGYPEKRNGFVSFDNHSANSSKGRLFINQMENKTFIYFVYVVSGSIRVRIYLYDPTDTVEAGTGNTKTGIRYLTERTNASITSTESALTDLECAHAYFLDDFPFTIFAGKGTKPFVLFHKRNATANIWIDSYCSSTTALYKAFTGTAVVPADWTITNTAYDSWGFVPLEKTGSSSTNVGLYGYTGTDSNYFPHHVCFHGNRLIFAGSDLYPQRIWMSKMIDIMNFDFAASGRNAQDSAYIDLTKQGSNVIKWICGWEQLIVGTSNGIYIVPHEDIYVAGTSNGNILNVYPTKILNIGCAAVPPVQLDGLVVFVQNGNRQIRAINFNELTNRYFADNILLRASHIGEQKIIEMHVQYRKTPVLMCLMEDGTIARAIYNNESKQYGFSRNLIKRTDQWNIVTFCSLYDKLNNQEFIVGYENESFNMFVEMKDVFYDLGGVVKLPDIYIQIAINGAATITAGSGNINLNTYNAYKNCANDYVNKIFPVQHASQTGFGDFYIRKVETDNDGNPYLGPTLWLDTVNALVYEIDKTTLYEPDEAEEGYYRLHVNQTPSTTLPNEAMYSVDYVTMEGLDLGTASLAWTYSDGIGAKWYATINTFVNSFLYGVTVSSEFVPFPPRQNGLREKQITKLYIRVKGTAAINVQPGDTQVETLKFTDGDESYEKSLMKAHDIIDDVEIDNKLTFTSPWPRPCSILQVGYILNIGRPLA